MTSVGLAFLQSFDSRFLVYGIQNGKVLATKQPRIFNIQGRNKGRSFGENGSVNFKVFHMVFAYIILMAYIFCWFYTFVHDTGYVVYAIYLRQWGCYDGGLA